MSVADTVSDFRLALVAAVDTAPAVVVLTGRASGNILPESSLDATEARPLITYNVTNSEASGPGEAARITVRLSTFDSSDGAAVDLMSAVIDRLTAPILATGTGGSPQIDGYIENSVGLDITHPTAGESQYDHDLTFIAERMADAAELDVVTKVYGDSRYLQWGVPIPLIISIDGGGLPLNPGTLPSIPVDLDAEIVGAEILGDVSGSADVRLWIADKDDHYPPIAADDVTAGTFTLTAATRREFDEADLAGFSSLELVAGQAIRPHLESVSNLSQLTIKLLITRSTPSE